jgi:hypothetical protein
VQILIVNFSLDELSEEEFANSCDELATADHVTTDHVRFQYPRDEVAPVPGRHLGVSSKPH